MVEDLEEQGGKGSTFSTIWEWCADAISIF